MAPRGNPNVLDKRRPPRLRVRLLALSMLVAGAMTGAIWLIAREAFETARQQQISDAREHFTARTQSMDKVWRNSAYSISELLGVWQSFVDADAPSRRDARLRALLVPLLDQGEFSHIEITGVDGTMLFRYGTRSQFSPVAPTMGTAEDAGWAYSEPDRLVYRTLSRPIHFDNQTARLTLFAPVDQAVLARMVYPNTRVQLHREDQTLATVAPPAFDSSEHLDRARLSVAWDTHIGAPVLLVERIIATPPPTTNLLAIVAGCFGVLLIAGWLVLGRWIQSQTRRLHVIQRASSGFSGASSVAPEVGRNLDLLASDADDIGLHAGELRTMMDRIVQAHIEQAADRSTLHESEERLRLALDAAGMGTFDWDLVRDHITWSRSHEELWGFAPGEFGGGYAAFAQRMHPDDVPRIQTEITRCKEAGESFKSEFRVVWPDGTVHWVASMGGFEPDAAGQVVRMRGVVLEITERKRDEEEIRQLNVGLERRVAERTAELEVTKFQAEAASRAKSSFLVNMSHEIRTPMNAIVGLTFLVMREISDPVQRERLRNVKDASQHLLQIINDILDLSKIEAGKVVLEDADFDFDALLSRTFAMVGERARDKGLELVLDTGHVPTRLRGDATRLSQALINLLGNAIKFTQHGWVRLSCELLSGDEKRMLLRFAVQDTGEGIASDQQGGLFQAFQQADVLTTRRFGGTGLGLALTRHLAELMSGEVGLRSELGQGSTFWFTAWLGVASEVVTSAPPVAMQGLRVLLVDDLPESLAALAGRLRMLGLEVDAVSSGFAALEFSKRAMAAGRPYDLMLIDLQMEPMDGVESMRRLREALGDSTPPSILVTAGDAPTARQLAFEVCCEAVLVKPVTASELQDCLAGFLHDRRPTTQTVAADEGVAETKLRRLHAGRRVLVAEDNAISREVAAGLLGAVGLVVETADDGARAVELAATRPYDMILMDVQMPEMDGLAATRAIRARLGDATPIVAMTANAFGEERAASLDAGMNDHLSKPVDPELLYATLLRWLPQFPDELGESIGKSSVPDVAAAEVSPLSGRLEAIDGYDLAAGIRHVGGKLSSLSPVLRQFVSAHSAGEPAFLSPNMPDAVKLWSKRSHSIRGACALIGATRLQAELADFEQQLAACGDAQALERQARQLHEDLAALAERLGDALER
jgi:PAS domain S-box-containing protein